MMLSLMIAILTGPAWADNCLGGGLGAPPDGIGDGSAFFQNEGSGTVTVQGVGKGDHDIDPGEGLWCNEPTGGWPSGGTGATILNSEGVSLPTSNDCPNGIGLIIVELEPGQTVSEPFQASCPHDNGSNCMVWANIPTQPDYTLKVNETNTNGVVIDTHEVGPGDHPLGWDGCSPMHVWTPDGTGNSGNIVQPYGEDCPEIEDGPAFMISIEDDWTENAPECIIID